MDHDTPPPDEVRGPVWTPPPRLHNPAGEGAATGPTPAPAPWAGWGAETPPAGTTPSGGSTGGPEEAQQALAPGPSGVWTWPSPAAWTPAHQLPPGNLAAPGGPRGRSGGAGSGSGQGDAPAPGYPPAPPYGSPYGPPHPSPYRNPSGYPPPYGDPYGGGYGGGYGGYGGPGYPYGQPPWGQPGGPPPRRGKHAWTAALTAVALFVAAVLGISLATRQSTSGGAPSTNNNPFSNVFGKGGQVAGGGTASAQALALAAKVDPGVVDVNTVLGYQQGTAAGTGMVLTADGEVLTNNHVVSGATSIRVTVVTTGQTYNAKVLGTDPSDDVALIKMANASGLKTIALGDSNKVSPGDSVVAIGNALGQGGTPSVVEGQVQQLNQSITASDDTGGNPEQLSGLMQTSAALQPGDSGGPLVNSAGKVIGMDTAASQNFRFNASGGVSFAIPINTALSIAHQIESGKSSGSVHVGQAGFLGVEVSGTSGGALVQQVLPGTPAASAGLQAGDTVTSVDGKAIDSASGLTSALLSHHPGDSVNVGWVAGSGQSHSAHITLGTGPVN